MGRPKQIIATIEAFIAEQSDDKIFTSADFASFANNNFVRQLIFRLVKEKVLVNVGRGQYKKVLS